MKSAVRRTLAAVCMASVCALASAGSPAQSPQRTVRFADLDINHPAGAAVLYQRIRAAAREVCRPTSERDLAVAELTRSCVQDAIARAVTEVNAPKLSQYHATETSLLVVARR
ncbi:MAG: UrcA family protein [Steroidobacteraceae bacterium]